MEAYTIWVAYACSTSLFRALFMAKFFVSQQSNMLFLCTSFQVFIGSPLFFFFFFFFISSMLYLQVATLLFFVQGIDFLNEFLN